MIQPDDSHCCGACKSFQYEDIDGTGICAHDNAQTTCDKLCEKFEPEDEPVNNNPLSYEIKIHTSDIAETSKILLDLYNLIGHTTISQLTGEFDINISIVPKKK